MPPGRRAFGDVQIPNHVWDLVNDIRTHGNRIAPIQWRKVRSFLLICACVLTPSVRFHLLPPSGTGTPRPRPVMIRRRSKNLPWRHAATYLSLLLLGSSLLAFCQSGNASAALADQSGIQAEGPPSTIRNSQPDELKQELDADAIALSKIPADPLIRPDPVAPLLWPVDALVNHSIHSPS